MLSPYGRDAVVVGSDTPFAKSLAALSRFFVGDGTLEQTLTRVVDLSVEAVQAADMVGITMVVEGRNRTAVYTDELAPEIDEAQYEDGEGPCVQAFEQQRIMSITSTHDDGPGRGAGIRHRRHPLVRRHRSRRRGRSGCHADRAAGRLPRAPPMTARDDRLGP